MAPSDRADCGPRGPVGLDAHGLDPEGTINWNLEGPTLISKAVENGEGFLSAHDVLITRTGDRTGRSPNDKFIVREELVEDAVWWGEVNVPTTREIFDNLRTKVRNYLNTRDELFVQDLYAGADENQRLPIRVVTQNAWHSAFARNMFLRPSVEQVESHQPEFTVLHAPHFLANPEVDGVNSEVFVIVCFSEKTVIIGGTRYAGEIKKSIFSVMNYLLPKDGHLPMHCSANVGPSGDCAVFFGLSGTGKTTLSADPHRPLIGDDEHGWNNEGVFNFEGGCYAKMIDLSEEDEPEIFATSRMPGTILENVILDENGVPDFHDTSLTQNTRGSYPLEAIDNRIIDSKGGLPNNVVFLTCDAFGVLPPISRLTPEQAAYHFISGYTAKVAGTEIGVVEPQATFSACFGAPFMPMHPSVYADLLSKKVAENNASCWLLNTGWVAGGYGNSKRIKIRWTRALLNAALDGSLNSIEFVKDERFGFEIPTHCEGVPQDILNPKTTWDNGAKYEATADNLAIMFHENFKQFASGCSDAVLSAAPQPLSE
ncbi:MAG: phosphoenolpyruvate carboxykinase (ATP) [Euryarchaeota archaeon]|jgi:phosphoenolpyruvate carboxykinase (ATP)|nr:phosphoenolpyruvate carboxykinase (ATP) [Euryarchaeota archaeon]